MSQRQGRLTSHWLCAVHSVPSRAAAVRTRTCAGAAGDRARGAVQCDPHAWPSRPSGAQMCFILSPAAASGAVR